MFQQIKIFKYNSCLCRVYILIIYTHKLFQISKYLNNTDNTIIYKTKIFF